MLRAIEKWFSVHQRSPRITHRCAQWSRPSVLHGIWTHLKNFIVQSTTCEYHSLVKMNTNSTMIKTSFSIENILSKPDKRPRPSEPLIRSELMTDPVLDAGRNIHNEQVQNGENNNGFSVKGDSNGFTTPDSSCCDEENADTLSDITSEESCKFRGGKLFSGNLSTQQQSCNWSMIVIGTCVVPMSINRLIIQAENGRSSTTPNCFSIYFQMKIQHAQLSTHWNGSEFWYFRLNETIFSISHSCFLCLRLRSNCFLGRFFFLGQTSI